MDEQPEPTFTEAAIKGAARNIRLVYVALIQEGFTSEQAMALCQSMLPKGRNK